MFDDSNLFVHVEGREPAPSKVLKNANGMDDTGVFSDMKLIGEMYRPDMALLPIGDRFTMGPREAARAIELIGVEAVIPIHHGTFDMLTGTPEQLVSATAGMDVEIITLEPGECLA